MRSLHRTWMIPTLLALALGWPATSRASESREADWKVTGGVKLALLEKLGPEALEITVETDDGVVRLDGDVEKRETLELAPRIARGVEGARRVESNLTLEPGEEESPSKLEHAKAEVQDGILETRLRIALVDGLGLDGFKVGTEAVNGVVLLEFDRHAPKSLRKGAIRIAKALDGVRKVKTTFKD